MANDKLLIGVGQALEIQQAFRREGRWTNEEIKKLCEQKGFLTDVRSLLLNRIAMEHLINCDEVPFIPDGWSILPKKEQLPNRVKGLYKLDITKVMLHLPKKQGKDWIQGNELREMLKKEAVLPANVLDFLLKEENQHLIPEEWKGKYVFFWGTIYRDSSGDFCVRCLFWSAFQWSYFSDYVGRVWGDNYPPVVLASN